MATKSKTIDTAKTANPEVLPPEARDVRLAIQAEDTSMFSTMGVDVKLSRDDVVSIVTSRIEENTINAIEDAGKSRTKLTKDINDGLDKVRKDLKADVENLLTTKADKLQQLQVDVMLLQSEFPGQTADEEDTKLDELKLRSKKPVFTIAINVCDRTAPEDLEKLEKYNYSIHGYFDINGQLTIPPAVKQSLADVAELRRQLTKTEQTLLDLKTSLGNLGRFERQAKAKITSEFLSATEEGRQLLAKLGSIDSKQLQLIGK